MKRWIVLFGLTLPLMGWFSIANEPIVNSSSQDVSQSIQKATAYLHSDGCGMDYSVYAVYHYLERLYKVPSIKSDTFFINRLVYHNTDSTYYKRLLPFFCLTRAVECRYDSSIYEKNSLDDYMYLVLSCQHHTLPIHFLDTIWQLANTPSYYDLTHAYLMLQWLEELKCQHIDWTKEQQLKQHIKQGLIDLLYTTNNQWEDVYLEALAFLCYTDTTFNIPSKWLEGVIAAQQTDGGWKYSRESTHSSAHATVFGLWILLASTTNTPKPIPWIYPDYE